MILYHGTSESAGTKILKEGKLIANIKDRVWKGLPDNDITKTTDGFVYLTDLLQTAIHWGNKTSIILKEKEIYLFKVDIEKEDLLPDLDEIAIEEMWLKKEIEDKSAENILNMLHSTCIDRDCQITGYIKLNTYDIDRVLIKVNSIRPEKLNEMQKIILDKALIAFQEEHPFISY